MTALTLAALATALPSQGHAPPAPAAVAALFEAEYRPPPQSYPPPARPPRVKVDAADAVCLALNVYWEARGEPDEGKVAVAHVTLNRAADPAYPPTVCAVVRQGIEAAGCQFSWTCDDIDDTPTDQAAWEDAKDVARRVLADSGRDPTKGALFFHHTRLRPAWAEGKSAARVIGQHVFFRLEHREHAGDKRMAHDVALAKAYHGDVGQRLQPPRDVGQPGHPGEEIALVGVAGQHHGGMPAEAGQ
jgi:spore germination cell wall hydrolase CwlJ-like protein